MTTGAPQDRTAEILAFTNTTWQSKKAAGNSPATFLDKLSGGGDRTRTCIAFRPAVFKTAALPLCDPSAGWAR